MVFGSKFVICAIFALVQFVRSDKIFPNQYLGRYLNDTEYESREKCDTTVCLEDADRLIYAATREVSIKPCDDFKTFAMGEFYLHRKKNDRYDFIGFYHEIYHLNDERYRNALESPMKKDDLKVHKFLKSHFKKCADLGEIRKHGGDDILAYLHSLGGSPLIASETWNETKFDVATLIESDPMAFNFFTDHDIERCDTNRYIGLNQDGTEPICLKKAGTIRTDRNDMLKVLLKFKFDEIKQQKAVEDYEGIIETRISEDEYYSGAKFIQIKDLSSNFPHLNINWLKIINNRLFSTSQITEDEQILIGNPDYLNQTLLILSTMDKGVIANAFTANFLLQRRDLIITHFLTTEHAEFYKTKQSRQRFEICLFLFWNLSFHLTLDSLLAKEKFNKELQNAANEFIMEAVADLTIEIEELKTSDDEQELSKEEMIEKLKNVQLQVMFLDEVLNDSIINKLYDELAFDEKMSLFDLQVAMESYAFKVKCERSSSLIRTLNRKVVDVNLVTYFVEENILVVPSRWTLPPFFVPNRSRFFNVATLYTHVQEKMLRGLENYVYEKHPNFDTWYYFYHIFYLNLNKYDLADKYYVKWEENGGNELQLSSFKLTNRQMLWLCIANVHATQFRSGGSVFLTGDDQILGDYYHISFKRHKRFREVFQCDELTQWEEDIKSEFENLLEME